MRVWLDISGRGGELVLSPISESAFNYWRQQSVDKLENYVLNHCRSEVPDEFNFIDELYPNPVDWHEMDSLGHYFGAHPSHANLSIDVEVDDVIRTVLVAQFRMAIKKTGALLKTSSINLHNKQRTRVLQIFSYEKGSFFQAEIELDKKSDFKNLTYECTSFISEKLVTAVKFNGVEVDNVGGDTTGKGIFCSIGSL